MQIFSIVALLAFVLIQGCSTAPKKPLDRTEIDRLESIKLVVVIPSEELEADVQSSNISTYTGGGLIFALADVAIEKGRATVVQNLIAPVQDSLSGVELSRDISQKLAERLKEVAWLDIESVETISGETKSDWDIQADSHGQDLLVIRFRSSVSNKANPVKTAAIVSLYLAPSPLTSESQDSHVVIFQKNLTSNKWVSSQYKTPEERVRAWSENNGELVKNGLLENTDKIAEKIISFLNRAYKKGTL